MSQSELIQKSLGDDELVAVVACNSILDRAFSKAGFAKVEKYDLEARIAGMSCQEPLARMRAFLEPMRQYSHELDEERAKEEVTKIDSGVRR
jgi:hypothetical protein